MNPRQGLRLLVGCAVGGAIVSLGDCALGQSRIIPDSTLGAESSTVVPNYGGLPVEAIAGGAVRGGNLFHSFLEFNVSAGRGAYFYIPNAGIQNILARVTGKNFSEILGTLGTLGNSNPNLFLINPNGIIFGQNASLNLNGSFVATTANAVRLGDKGLFSASEPATSNLLSINPSAFFFNSLSHGAIVNSSIATTTVLGTSTNGLQVSDSQSLLLLGGDVRMDGGELQAAGGRVELGGLAGAGIVGLNIDGNNLHLSFPNNAPRSDVMLTNGASVDARGDRGSIAVNAQNLDILGGSGLAAGTGVGGTANSKAGDIEIDAEGAVNLKDESLIFNIVGAGTVGKGGNVDITTGSLSLNNGSQLLAITRGQGDAGNVIIHARDAVSFDGVGSNGFSSGAFSSVEQGAVGKGGNVNITTGSLSLTNGTQLSASTFGQGDAGNIDIQVSGLVTFKNSYVVSNVQAKDAIGNGGEINIKAGSVIVQDGAQVNAFTRGQGNAGNIFIDARDAVSLQGNNTVIFSGAEQGATGKGGNINITTGSLSLTNGAQLTTSTSGRGDAGNIDINASGHISLEGISTDTQYTTGITSDVNLGAVGRGGNIHINAGSLAILPHAELRASTFGQGDAGNIDIQVSGLVTFKNSYVASNVQAKDAIGNGGEINIKAGSAIVQDGAQVNAFTRGQGNAGNIFIDARDAVSLQGNNTAIFSSAEQGATGKGGNIDIASNSLNLTDGAYLFSGTYGQGNAGNISIDVRDAVSLQGNNTGINSVAEQGATGKSGNIDIASNSLNLTDGAYLSSGTYGQGNAGDIFIDVRDAVDVANNSGINSNTLGSGLGGDIYIRARSLNVRNDSRLGADTFGTGKGGDLTIEVQNLKVSESQVSASTRNGGEAGNLTVKASETVELTGEPPNGRNGPGGLLAQVDAGAGRGGNLFIETKLLSISNGSKVQVANFGQGKAGNIFIRADEIDVFNTFDATNFYATSINAGASIDAVKLITPKGDAGSLTIETGRLSVRNGGRIEVGTDGTGNAGVLKIQARDLVEVIGKSNTGGASTIRADVSPGANGRGGDITIETAELNIDDGGAISASAKGIGQAGNLFIRATDYIKLDNQATISAQTTSGDGGNITLQAGKLMLLRHGSLISTSAGTAQAGGNGGNITINAPLIVAVPKEDSDIRANAYTGAGGNVNITTQGLFGIQFRPQDTPLSDITASSQFGINGTVQINTPGVDPSRGLTDLATAPVDASKQIAQNCPNRGSRRGSSFIITGNGGLPPRPEDPFTSPYPTGTVRGIPSSTSSDPATSLVSSADTSNPDRPPVTPTIVEAQGWVYGPHGEVILTATAPTLTPQNAGVKPATCPQS